MSSQHSPTPGAHPADTLVVPSADNPLRGQAESNSGHAILMSCGKKKTLASFSKKNPGEVFSRSVPETPAEDGI